MFTYAGPLQDNVAKTPVQGQVHHVQLRRADDPRSAAATRKLTLVSATSIVEGGYHDVSLRTTGGSNN